MSLPAKLPSTDDQNLRYSLRPTTGIKYGFGWITIVNFLSDMNDFIAHKVGPKCFII